MILGLGMILVMLNILDSIDRIGIPVKNATVLNWDNNSFWAYPWSDNTVHKGVDIFGNLNTEIISPVNGIVTKTGYSNKGGNYIYVVSYDLKFYYFAHLNKRIASSFSVIGKGEIIGLMGDTGNASFAPFHLHLSIFSPIPMLSYFDLNAKQGWQKMFYLNPIKYF